MAGDPSCWVCGGLDLFWVRNGRVTGRCECLCETRMKRNQKTVASQQAEIDRLKAENAQLKQAIK